MIGTFYARVSTDSEEQKTSIVSQVSYFTTYLDQNNLLRSGSGVFFKANGTHTKTDGYYVDEGFSGAKSNKYRKAFQQMMKDARVRKFDIIYTKSISRFGRNTKEILAAIAELRSYDIAVYFEDLKINTMNREDDFKLTIFAAQAEEESRAKSESVQFGKKQAYKREIWGGRAPYGYDIEEGKLKINDLEARTVKEVFRLYLYEGLGLRNIAQTLNSDGVPTKRGASLWDQSLISKMLKNAIYTGEWRQHRTRNVDINQNLIKEIPLEEQIVKHIESLIIIDQETFRLVQIEKGKRKGDFGNLIYKEIKVESENGEVKKEKVRSLSRGKTRHSSTHILSNLLKCGNCGGSLRRKVQKNKKRTFVYWICRNNDQFGNLKCEHRNLQYEENIFNYLKNEIFLYISNKEIHNENLDYYINSQFDLSDVDSEIKNLTQEINELENERDVNFRLLTKNIIDDSEYEKRNKNIKLSLSEKESKRLRLENAGNEIEEIQFKHKQFLKFLNSVDLDSLTNPILRQIIERIEVTTPNNHLPLKRFVQHVFNSEHLKIYWNVFGASRESRIEEAVDKQLEKYLTKV
ncbi:recombinase family protein [Paenibacillus xylanexedens]|uniref:recombinase family protein n=1 Tax=Paenibacillus xylanexedens TaxID=528191 RepID=UPI000F53FC29|nr:recombinase family protein [Paenibacillus xylanexedens]RPK29394.1 hypothetical protein EDO6_00017 [Paenibacillus xylanexedens]